MIDFLDGFYRGKRVLVTGHTGFKGSWLCKLLTAMGAEVIGYALEPVGPDSLFSLCSPTLNMDSVIGDIRDLKHLQQVFAETRPEIVIHMAAQPIVRASYGNPVYTYEVNVMGTVHVLECIRSTGSVRSFLNVTTDKVYLNREWEWGYRENDELNGLDPYSNSKSCSELVTDCYKKSFFQQSPAAVSTARAGNVIGGGDFAADRIIPDCVRAVKAGKEIIVRNPGSVRPYQHVLEPLAAYLLICKKQYGDPSLAGSYNVGPDETDCRTTGELVTLFCDRWNAATGDTVSWRRQSDGGPGEAGYLKLDCSKMKRTFGWRPRWNTETAVEKIIDWLRVYFENGNISECMEEQIRQFVS